METNIKPPQLADRLIFGEIFYADQEIYFDCLFCNSIFDFSELNFIEHLENHLDNSLTANDVGRNDLNRFFCPMEDCEYSTKVKGLLSTHMIDLHELNNRNPLEILQIEKVNTNLIEPEDISPFDKADVENEYCCPTCDKNFDTKLRFLEHIEQHHIDQASDDDIKSLLGVNDENKDEFESTSDDGNKSNKDFKFVKKNKDNSYNCSHCDDVFNYRSNLNRHLQNIHGIYSSLKFEPNGDGKYDCLKCDLVCSKVANLNFHMMRKHKSDYERLLIKQNQLKQINDNNCAVIFEKDICEVDEFIDESRLQEFNFDVANINSRDLPENNYGNKDSENFEPNRNGEDLLDDNEGLIKSFTYIEKSANNHYNCSHCHHTFLNRPNLNRHLQKKHGIFSSLKFDPNEDGKYKCLKCDLICSKVANLNLHMMRKHKNDFTYLIVKQQVELNRSQKLIEEKILNDHHSINAEEGNVACKESVNCSTVFQNVKIYECNYCEKQFDNRDLFHQHLKSDHGIIVTINFEFDKDGNFKCPKCDVISKKGSITLHMLQNHKKYYEDLLAKEYDKINDSIQKMELDSMCVADQDIGINNNKIYFETSNELFDDEQEDQNSTLTGQNLQDNTSDKSNYSKKNYPMINLKPSSDGLYRCKKCNLTCSRKSNLYVHLKRKHFQYFMKCVKNEDQECESYASDTEMKEIKDKDMMNFKCKFCSMRYNRRDNLNRHLKVKHGILTTLNFIPNSNGKYECKVCELICEKKVSLHFHMQKKHSDLFDKMLLKEQEEYNCSSKSVQTTNRKSRDTNVADLNFSEVDGLWHCPHCEVVKTKPKLIRNHIREKHMKNSTCHFCGKELSSACSLRTHLKTHQEPEYKCEYCNKLFAHKHNLTIHVRIHMGIKKYNCYYCEKQFVSLNEKKSHEKRIHIKEKTHQCDTCGTSFYTATRLKYHIQRHTGEKPFECEICFRRFYDRRLLRDHLVSHSTEKPYVCDICDSKYARKVTLIKHKKKQHGIHMRSQPGSKLCLQDDN